tara:strand:- start:53383 stop:60459 length:7077 start_codon:yes stop_codon:yes gene_type:complete
MSKFVLTAQLQLQAPRNAKQVISDVRRQLQGVNIPVEVQGTAEAKRQVDKVAKSTRGAAAAANDMGRSFGLAFKRFAAFTVASRAVSLFTNTLAGAVEEAIDFQREMIKISQVTGKTVESLQGLEKTIGRLSTSLGVSSKQLIGVTRILSQAGFEANELEVALAALAKTTLAPTFEDIEKTAEGAVAIFAQFGQGAAALEQQLGSINAVAGQFAVESGDLIGAVRRVGGVFVEAGGDLEDLLGLFTSVRATTRESAESISTGLRTIFTRIQRPRTIEFLRQYNVELQDMNGNFVGPLEAIRRLNAELSGLDQGDIRFIEIAEEIAGFRQIGKVLPLIKEFELAEKARQAALEGGNSLNEDAAKAQQALAVQIIKVKEEFQELIRSIANTASFQAFVKTSLDLASALIKVADAIKPLIPLIGVLATVKLAKGLSGFMSGFGGAIKGGGATRGAGAVAGKNQGGRIRAFNTGGMVPGTGNRDTVPAMLTPGEFVIRKSSVKKMGASNLAAMNAKGYALGGPVIELKDGVLGNFALRPNEGDDVDHDLSGYASKKSTAQLKNVQAAAKLRQMAGLPAKDTSTSKVGAFSAMSGPEQQKALHDPKAGRKYRFGANTKIGAKAHQNVSKILDSTGEPHPELIKHKVDELSKIKGRPVTAKAAARLIRKQVNSLNIKAAAEGMSPLPVTISGKIKGLVLGSRTSGVSAAVEKQIKQSSSDGLRQAISDTMASETVQSMSGGSFPIQVKSKQAQKAIEKNLLATNSAAVSNIAGFVQEGLINNIVGAPVAGGGTAFDFPNVSSGLAQKRLKLLYGKLAKSVKAGDAKPAADLPNAKAVASKYAQSLNTPMWRDLASKKYIKSVSKVSKFAQGGNVDSVPALLTPGEFVINKKAASSIGQANLQSMNKSGVAKFNKGGPVGFQRFNTGGNVNPITSKKQYKDAVQSASGAKEITKAISDTSKEIKASQQEFEGLSNQANRIQAAFEANTETIQEYNNRIIELNQAGIKTQEEEKELQELISQRSEAEKKNLKLQQRKIRVEAEAEAALAKTIDLENKKQGLIAKAKSGGRDAKQAATQSVQSGIQSGQQSDFKTLSSKASLKAQADAARAAKYKAAADKKAAQAALKGGMSIEKLSMTALGLQTGLAYLRPTIDDNSSSFEKFAAQLVDGTNVLISGLLAAAAAAQVFGTSLSVRGVMDFLGGGGKVAAAVGGKVAGAGRSIARSGVEKIRAGRAMGGGAFSKGGLSQATGKMQVGIGRFTTGASKATAAITQVAGPMIAAGLAAKLAGDMITAFTNHQDKMNKAMEKGNVAEAQRQAVLLQNQKAAHTFGMATAAAGAGIGFMVGGPLGAFVGGLAGAVVMLAQFSDTGQSVIGTMSEQLGFDTADTTKANVKAQMTQIRVQKDLAKATQKAAQELEKVKAGEVGIGAAMSKGGALARTGELRREGARAEMEAAETNLREQQRVALQRATGNYDNDDFKIDEMGNAYIDNSDNPIRSFFAGGDKTTMQDYADTSFDLGFVSRAREGKGLTEAQARVDQAQAKFQEAQRENVTENLETGAFKQLMEATLLAGDSLDNFEGSYGDFLDNLESINPETYNDLLAAGQHDTIKQLENFQKSLKQTIDTMKNMNYGLSNVRGGLDAANINIRGIANAAQVGASSFQQSFDVLSAATGPGGQNISETAVNTALADLEGTIGEFGGSDKATEDAISTIKGINFAQRENMDNVTMRVQENLSATPEEMQRIIGEELLRGVKGPARDRMETAIGNVKLNQDDRKKLRAGDTSVVSDKIFGELQKGINKDILPVLQKRGELEAQLVDVTKRKIAQEKEYIAAQKQAIETQIEAGKLFEEFGGAKLTSSDQLSARVAAANLDLEMAGIGGMESGGIDDMRGALASIRSGAFQQADQMQFGILGQAKGAVDAEGKPIQGAFRGAEGVEENKQEELKAANQSLVTFTKQRISLIKEELNIAKQKNKAESDALNKLLDGDVEGFLDQQLASVAGSALRLGDAGIAANIGAGALGAGFQTLEGQGLSDRQMERAAAMSLSGVGITDPRAAQVLAGTTAEEEALKAEGRELSSFLGEAAQQQADLEKLDVNTGLVEIEATNVSIKQTTDELKRKQEERDAQAPLEERLRQRGQQNLRTQAQIDAEKAAEEKLAEETTELENGEFAVNTATINVQNAEGGEGGGEGGDAQNLARGGVVYANRGMFIPKGTDTVPAMLTPGEFVVNRSAVQRGNNLAVLKAMNGGMGMSSGGAMARGGMVKYMQEGGVAYLANGSGSSMPDISVSADKLVSFANQFESSVQKLLNFQLQVKVDPTNVTVNFQGANFLAGLKDSIKNELLEKVRQELGNAKFNEAGELRTDTGM